MKLQCARNNAHMLKPKYLTSRRYICHCMFTNSYAHISLCDHSITHTTNHTHTTHTCAHHITHTQHTHVHITSHTYIHHTHVRSTIQTTDAKLQSALRALVPRSVLKTSSKSTIYPNSCLSTGQYPANKSKHSTMMPLFPPPPPPTHTHTCTVHTRTYKI